MQPNRLGGQTFNYSEMLVFVNILSQARNSGSMNSGNTDYLCVQTGLQSSISVYNELTKDIDTIQKAFDEGTPELIADQAQTQRVLGCLRWAIEDRTKLAPNVTPPATLKAATQILSEFDGEIPFTP